MADSFVLAIRTPHEVVFEGPVCGARVPTETGQVGLRPRGEPMVLGVEPGLVVLRLAEGPRFAATVGGLLEATRDRATLLTPVATVGESEREMLEALATMRVTPAAEVDIRRQLGELEQRIIREIGDGEKRPARGARS